MNVSQGAAYTAGNCPVMSHDVTDFSARKKPVVLKLGPTTSHTAHHCLSVSAMPCRQ